MKKNQKLDTAFAYQDKSGNWYMKLTYAYEDEKGLHKVIFPKVEFPFVTRGIPFLYDEDYDEDYPGCVGFRLAYSSIMCIETVEHARLSKATDQLAEAKGVNTPSYAFDIVIDPAVHEENEK